MRFHCIFSPAGGYFILESGRGSSVKVGKHCAGRKESHTDHLDVSPDILRFCIAKRVDS